MKYDFDKIIDRKNTNSLKWDEKPGSLPLWVADMDFETAPQIKNAILGRAEHGVFGYSVIPEEWSRSYSEWWKKRHGLKMESDELIFCTGIVPAISSLVRKLTSPAEKVLIQTPVYNIFFNSILNNGRFVLESPLDFKGNVNCDQRTGETENGNKGERGKNGKDEKNGSYSINFERLEKDLSDKQVSLMILCNPHNPCGKIWSKSELKKIASLCKKHGVKVISDEIHCDITKPGKKYVPFASVSETAAEISVTCISPSKCFNIAGLNSAAVFVPNPLLRHKVWRALNTDEIAEPNAFAVCAAVSAFSFSNGSEEWLSELNEYLFSNRKFAEDFIESEIPVLNFVKADATYLLWVDVSRTGMSGIEFAEKLKAETGLFINEGAEYGKAGENFARINLACPRSVLEDALSRLKKFCESHLNHA